MSGNTLMFSKGFTVLRGRMSGPSAKKMARGYFEKAFARWLA